MVFWGYPLNRPFKWELRTYASEMLDFHPSKYHHTSSNTGNFWRNEGSMSSEHPTQRQEPQSGGLANMLGNGSDAWHYLFSDRDRELGLPSDRLIWQFVFSKAMPYPTYTRKTTRLGCSAVRYEETNLARFVLYVHHERSIPVAVALSPHRRVRKGNVGGKSQCVRRSCELVSNWQCGRRNPGLFSLLTLSIFAGTC